MTCRNYFAAILAALCSAFFLSLDVGCENALSPERTPERVVIGFLKAVGRGNMEAAKAFVVPESQGQIQNWYKQLFFPDHATPPSSGDEQEIDHFIALFYKITPTSNPTETDTQIHARLSFAATDAMVGFPSVVNNPLIPNSALFMVTLTRSIVGEGKKAKPGPWLIASISPQSEHP